MNNLAFKVFDNEQFGCVRTITKDEQPWFVGVDVARALGYKNPRNVVNTKVWKQNKDVCSLFTSAVTETSVPEIGTHGQEQEAETSVPEIGTHGQEQEAETSVPEIGTQGQEQEAETTVPQIGTQGHEQEAETSVPEIGTHGQEQEAETTVPQIGTHVHEQEAETTVPQIGTHVHEQEVETSVPEIGTQGREHEAETSVPEIGTQGREHEAETSVPEIGMEGQNRDVTIINEAGLYQLIFGSKLESAKAFQNWVFSEVLPSIRKMGGYQMNERQVDIQRNYNHLVSNMTNVTIISQLSSVLATHGVEIGPNRMWEYLRNMGIVIKSGYRVNLPKIESIKNGLIESELTEMGVYINRLTPKGLDKVVTEILRGEKPIVSIALF